MHVGLDIGTSGTKASVVSTEGSVLDFQKVDYHFCNYSDGLRELDPGEIWGAVKTCLSSLRFKNSIKTITVSSLGEAFVTLDNKGEPLYPCITGTDIRGSHEISDIESAIGRDKIIEITGVSPGYLYSAPKIAWLLANKSDQMEQMWKILTIQDYIVFKLSGQAVVDYSVASRTMFLDVNKLDWSAELLDCVGIEKKNLSHPVRSGTIVSKILPEVAIECGINGDAKIVVGCHDHIANTLGSGSYLPGDCANIVGTTEGITAIIDSTTLRPKGISDYKISKEPFIKDGLFNTVAWTNTSGVLLKWFAQEFIQKLTNNDDLLEIYHDLNSSMVNSPTDLLVLPHFSGAGTPYDDSLSKGAIIGLHLGTTTAEIYRAIMEGINFDLALIIESLNSAGICLKKIVSSGGALSDQMLQIKADIIGQEIHTIQNSETGTLGGAMIGAVSHGDFKSIEEAISLYVIPGKSYYPIKENNDFYSGQFRQYKKLYPRLKDIYHSLSKTQEKEKLLF